jgi:hypothetical protein
LCDGDRALIEVYNALPAERNLRRLALTINDP